MVVQRPDFFRAVVLDVPGFRFKCYDGMDAELKAEAEKSPDTTILPSIVEYSNDLDLK